MTQGSQRDRTSVSLFPFLAVLICTMGALIVLLVIVVQQSRNTEKASADQLVATHQESAAPAAAGTAASPSSVPPEENGAGTLSMTPQQELDDLRWQIKEVEASRETTRGRVRDQQLQLSIAEDEIRELASKLERLETEAEQFEASQSNRLQDETSIAAESARIQAEIAAKTAELDAAKKQVENRTRQFAIIPYEGPQGTNRRPIYLECLEDRVLIQPEGIVLVADDFPDAMGPDNVLAVMLRATREYWLNHGVASNSGDAYPLMIVRPRGARVYAACRAALQGWDEEFGYELVPKDMVIAFPAPDPSLAQFLTTTLAETRARLGDQPTTTELSTEGFANQPFGLSNQEGDETSNFGSDVAEKGGDQAGSGGSEPDSLPTGGSAGGGGPGFGAGGGGAGGFGSDESIMHEVSNAPPGASMSVQAVRADSAAAADVVSIAATRGENWALPNVAGHSIAISRPVDVVCAGNGILLETEGSNAEAVKVFAFEGTTRSAIQPFVNALWNRIEGWGVAGPSAYWKPVLKVSVQDPTAEARFADLRRLLEGSGLEVQRR